MTPLRCREPEPAPSEADLRLLDSVYAWAFRNCVPLHAMIEITLACNNRCLHCYNFDRSAPRDAAAQAEALNPQEIMAVMADLRREGCLFLSFTGGEVLTHPRLFEFLDRAQALHFSVRLLTNGTLLSSPVVDRLARYANLLGVELSLYGASAAVHDCITRAPGSFDRTWEGAERVRARGTAVRLKFVLMKQNLHETGSMMAMADERGFPYSLSLSITGRYDGTFGSLATRIDEGQLDALSSGPLRRFVPKGNQEVTSESFACHCARANCAITSSGDVHPCIAVPWKAGNIRETPFGEIWRNSPVFRRIRGLRLEDYPHCAPCPHKAWCPRDRGANYLASGDYTGVDPFVCRTAEVWHRISAAR